MGRLDFEKAVIGSVLIEPPMLAAVRDILKPEYFFSERLGEIFALMCEMADKRQGIDALTVCERDKTPNVNALLLDCMEAVATAGNARDYARFASEAYFDAEIVKTSRKLIQEDDAAPLVEELTRLVTCKLALTTPPTFDYGPALVPVIDEILTPKKRRSIKTHYDIVDKCWNGAEGGEINTWGAATNVGKSVMLLNLAHRSALNGDRILYVGTEMNAAETVRRHLSIASHIAAWRLRNAGELKDDDFRKINDVVAETFYGMPFSILDLAEPSLDDVEAAIVAKKPGIVFLDYLERFALPKEDNLRLRIKEFMRRLKNMARRRNVVIHLAAQLSRQAYGLEEKRPTLAELSESSAVEKESDRVMLMWTPKARQDPMSGGTVIEVIQAKNRHGQRGINFELVLNERDITITERYHGRPETYA